MARHDEQNARVKNLLARIEEERRDFEREIASRRRLLETLEPQGPTDPILAGIAESWKRLSEYHHQRTARYHRRFGKPPPRKAAIYEPSDGDWRNAWQFEADKRRGLIPISNTFNILLAFREAPALAGLIATDLDTGKIMLKAPLPLRHDPTFDDDFEMRQLRLADVTALREYLNFIGLVKASHDDVAAAIKVVAAENAWRPIDG